MTNLYNYNITFIDHDNKIRCYKNDYSMRYDEAIRTFKDYITHATSKGYVITSARLIKVN